MSELHQHVTTGYTNSRLIISFSDNSISPFSKRMDEYATNKCKDSNENSLRTQCFVPERH